MCCFRISTSFYRRLWSSTCSFHMHPQACTEPAVHKFPSYSHHLASAHTHIHAHTHTTLSHKPTTSILTTLCRSSGRTGRGASSRVLSHRHNRRRQCMVVRSQPRGSVYRKRMGRHPHKQHENTRRAWRLDQDIRWWSATRHTRAGHGVHAALYRIGR